MTDIYKYIALDKTESGKKPRSVHMSENTDLDLRLAAEETGFSQNLIVKLGCKAAREGKKALMKEMGGKYKRRRNKKVVINEQ